ncbi:alpha/beta hydrolase [Trinickia caryophylli]|uniref:Acetyl esterase/lipase n=1 Tax=Trinickia caryophylli TaxID=28094 RepID=A0A1X7ES57_TRICW|nr:alpha/beta hydrolase [Trinickia caryophylli]PMS12096.1 alpha/beta hydrolase [Trinickia caryophylli]TRX18598.1 alpha/beta hydrolase [Trinickia caryophylli]WQE10607.1 alpha/beta hydrolase [Trinickia caryophylli]SMF39276.1 Acetyl esterase/lipase [Trinickia caryophylli]GLU32973.1 hydrolase [Trinickia caryophylli]
MSWQSALVCWVLKRQFRPETEKPHVDVERARLRAAARVWAPKVPAGWRLRECYRPEDAPLLGEWLEPIGEMAGGGPRMTVLYLHGGGYYFCSPKSHRSLVFQLAVLTGARTFSLAYRLAPEHPFPAALDDALAAYRHLIASGAPPGSVVIAGDSAGGGLALATLVALRDAGDPLPAAALLFSPWTDLAATGATLATNDGADPMFRGAAVARAARFYVGGADPRHPYVSPLYADFTGLPPLLIEAGASEVLLDDARRAAARAHAAGVEVDFRIWPKMPHVWQIFAPFVPEARRSLERAAAFARRHAGARGARLAQLRSESSMAS